MHYDMKGGNEASDRIGKESTELEAVDFDAFNSMFSLRKPRDIGAGLSSGTKSLVKGILAGTVSLVGGPVIGAVSEGWVGFAKGLGVGEPADLSYDAAILLRTGLQKRRTFVTSGASDVDFFLVFLGM